MTKRKTLLYFVARATMTLFLAVAGITNASAAAHWVGNSAIYVNGTWYYAGTEFDWCTGGAFDGANLGTFVNSIPLAGQSQNHEYGDVNWNDGSVTMYYKIDGGEQQSISLPWQSYNSDTHNNLFESKDEYGDFVITSVDISGLSAGSHTIEVYFYCDNAWDSNNSQNYKANFTVCDATKTVSYIDENGETQNVEANVLANGADVSSLSGWNVVEGTANFFSTLTFTADARLILADGTSLTINSSDCGIYSDYNFSMYSQSTGNNQGVINATGGYSTSICVKDISIYGGVVHVYDSDYGIFTTGNISIYGGNIDASGESYGIDANYGNGTITIYGGSVKASSYGGTVKIASGLVYSDGTINNIKGTISDVSDIANKTLSLYGYSYLDENGDEQTCTNYTLLTNETDISSPLGTSGDETWYVVKGKVSYNNILHFIGDTHLILADDANFTINVDDEWGIKVEESGIESNITIYAQSIGESKGKVEIEARTGIQAGTGIHVWNGNLTINGGDIIANGYDNGIEIGYGGIIINDGSITASGTAYYGIITNTWGETSCDIIINGGTITATGDEDGINTEGNIIINGGDIRSNGDCGSIVANGTITLNGGTVTSSRYSDNVSIAEGLKYYNGSALIPDNFENSDLAGKTLQPCVKANYADGNYWSTFYSGSVGFTIDDAVNAYAYTAELGTDEITMHLLGKVIPKETAVIIVSESETITMSADAATNVSTVPLNNLHGVDVATATTSVLSDYPGATTLYFLSNQNSNFGFHDFRGSTVPARKAFLALDDSNGARGFSMVFEDDATGIRSIDSGKDAIGNEAGAWYDLRGRRLSGKPSQRGIYVNNGKKIVIK